MFYKKAVLKNFATLTEKYLCWSLFLIKLQAFRAVLNRKHSGYFVLSTHNYPSFQVIHKFIKSNKQRAKSNRQRAKTNEQRAKTNKERATSKTFLPFYSHSSIILWEAGMRICSFYSFVCLHFLAVLSLFSTVWHYVSHDIVCYACQFSLLFKRAPYVWTVLRYFSEFQFHLYV